jgi:hypothetical protein
LSQKICAVPRGDGGEFGAVTAESLDFCYARLRQKRH